jgi:Kef-type K+ transport system membrane component KefB
LTSLGGLSLALGAFIAGLVMSESEYSHQALAEVLPFRDSFNSLFFVSIGVLMDLRVVLEHPFIVLGLLLAVIVGKLLTGAGAMVAAGSPSQIGGAGGSRARASRRVQLHPRAAGAGCRPLHGRSVSVVSGGVGPDDGGDALRHAVVA